jgi:SAM-dependent methyltransferase
MDPQDTTTEDLRRTLGATFDTDAELYDAARPGYPDALFDDLAALARIPPGGRVLEIGSGTGQATLPLACRGYRVQCVELGARLAAVARRNLAAYPGVAVWVGAFEDWPLEPAAFDLALSATAFHWINPAVGYAKAARALKPSGALALIWNVSVQTATDRGFYDAVQAVYQRETPELAEKGASPAHPDEAPDRTAEIERGGHFGGTVRRRYVWEAEYDAASYIRLLRTYSDHIRQQPERRERLLAGIADFITTRFGGHITKGYLTELYVTYPL